MDRNPSPPPPSCDQEDEEDLAGGDCIGSTVYSKPWLFGVLSGLIQIVTLESDKSGSDDDEQQMELAEEMETEICRVWDMSMDEDVALFLQEFKAPDIFMGVLAKSRCPRLRCDGAEKLLLSSDIIALGSPCTKVLLTCGWPCCMENYCAAIHMKLQHTEFYAGFDDGWIPETSEEWKLLLHPLQNKSTRPTPKESLNGSLSDGPAPINVENVALLLAKAMGPDRAWSLLQECGLALELSAKFTRTCDILRIAERRQRALIQGMLEKCDRFLWSQQAEWEICRDTISF